MQITTLSRCGLAATIVAAGLAMAPLASAVTFTDVISFGDSLSDTGNISAVTGFPMPPYAAGRFTSNFSDGSAGSVWIEYVSGSYGLSSGFSVGGGTNYAWGGARTGPINAGLPPSLLDQVGFYLDDVSGAADPNALYSVFGGGNDVRDAVTANSVDNVVSMIEDLAAAGAHYFLVPNLPDIGLTPEGRTDSAPGGTGEELSALTAQFNGSLSDQLDMLEATLDITVIRFDLFSLFNMVLEDGAAFGFDNVTEGCFDGGLDGVGNLCADPDTFLFFDGIHPTAQGHALVGQYAVAAIEAALVPVPAALPLLFGALGALGLMRRRA